MSSHRTAAAIQARKAGGQEASLLHLFTLWRAGATILAGTRVPAAVSVWPHPRVPLACLVEGCHTWLFGDDDGEAVDRLAEHRRRCHP